MLFLVAGLPGRFAEWCAAVTARLAETMLGPTQILQVNTLDEISRSLLHPGPPHAVLASHQPGGRVRAALIAARRRFLVALDDPRVSLRQVIASERVTIAYAIGAVAGSCAGVAAYVSASGALVLVLGAEHASRDPEAAAAAIAEHFQLGVSNDSVAEIVRQLAHRGITAERDDAIEWWTNLDDATKGLAMGAFGPFVHSFFVEERQPIRWASDLFFRGDQAGEPASGSIDITGRARCLMHGPRIMVLPGHWLLVLELVFSLEAADYEFSVEISAGDRLEFRLIHPQHSGLCETRIGFVVDEAGEHPVDIRLSSQRAAFDGTVRLEGATLFPQPASTSGFGARLAVAEN
jgi:hypothetical protein